MKPAAALFSRELGEFLLPYDAVRTARDPDAALMEFLQSTYAAAADLGEVGPQGAGMRVGGKGQSESHIAAFSTVVGGLGLGQKRGYDRYQTGIYRSFP